MANPLPSLVERYYARCLPEPPERPQGTTLEQTGEIRLAPDRPWMPFSAEQSISATETAFLWHARFKMAPLVTGVVEDALEDGVGRLDARIWGVLPVAHARGVEIDRGETQRYLAELPWCPMAIRYNPSLEFRQTSDDTVRVWIGDETTYVDWRFDDSGDLVRTFTDTRARDGQAQPWEGRFDEFVDFGGIRAPSAAEVWWDTPEGPFVYWRGRVTALDWRDE